MTKKPITDALKDKLDELEVERRLSELAAQAEEVVVKGIARAGELTDDNRDRIEELLDRAGGALDRRTEGKYAEQIGRVRTTLERGVDRLAAQRPAEPPTPEPPMEELPPGDSP